MTPRSPADTDTRRRHLLRGLGAVAATAAMPSLAATPALPATSFYTNFAGTRLQDQDGRTLNPAQWLGKTVLVNFVYTGCSTVCPVQTRALAELQRQLAPALRDRVRQLSIALDPLNDTPAALRQFARAMGADLTTWTFATGRPEDVERLSASLRLFKPGPDVRRPDDHNTAIWLVDARGELRMRYGGNPPDVPRLLRELAALDAPTRPAPG